MSRWEGTYDWVSIGRSGDLHKDEEHRGSGTCYGARAICITASTAADGRGSGSRSGSGSVYPRARY